MRRYAFEGGTAVVTGAASGIGAALAAGLAARGSNLVLLDRDADGLAAVAAAARAMPTGVRVAEHVADLADPAAAVAAGEAIAAAHPETTLLINNAGVALAGRFDQVDAAQFDAVIAVNFQAVVTMTRALLPVLTAHPGAHLVGLSSIFGIVAPPGQTAYCASKFAVRGFLESLRGELAPMGVGVTCVHPGGVRTNIARNAIVGTRLPAAQWEAGPRPVRPAADPGPGRRRGDHPACRAPPPPARAGRPRCGDHGQAGPAAARRQRAPAVGGHAEVDPPLTPRCRKATS